VSAAAIDPILLCYDRSAAARRAVEAAGSLFPGHAALVLHVWSPLAVAAAAYGAVALDAYDEGDLQRGAQELAEEGAELARGAGLDAGAVLAESGHEGTWHTIVDAAGTHGAGMIVLGARGLSTFQSALLGSVSHGVAQHAHVPVLIVPPAEG
jgi:nucleotide-binding universal stress UspA family protein